MLRLVILSILIIAAACAPQVQRHSGRDPDLFDKESDHLEYRGRPVEGQSAPEMFVRQKEVVIKPAAPPNETGSLFNPEDERNYLFTNNGPYNVGRYLTIALKANRVPDKKAKGEPEKPTDPAAEAEKAKDPLANDVEDQLIKALPELAPVPGEGPTLPKTFKVKITHRFDNGDVLAMATRRSTVSGQGNEMTVQVRIPYQRLQAGEELTTDDLLDVHYVDSSNGELADRRSSGWEDEYSLRIAGFDEAKSKEAHELDDKRKKLEETKGKLEERAKQLGQERQKIAKIREENDSAAQKQAQAKAEADAKEAELKKKIEEKDKTITDKDTTIEEQKKALEDAKPDEKPGDKKESSGG